jgi:hypothetical protein
VKVMCEADVRLPKEIERLLCDFLWRGSTSLGIFFLKVPRVMR